VPLELQSKLLRALQKREIARRGSPRAIRVDFRLIAATNRHLEEMVETREFRSDLYYRLNVFPIRIPPLRERPEDIPPLVRYFVQRFAKRLRRPIESLARESMDLLCRWPWPGNVRELQNVIERAVILSAGRH
jgi:transcriptional regulator with GAF, ATPase, and Fis domain